MHLRYFAVLFAAVSNPVFANCIDSDGDGWGWDGTASCRVESTSQAGECIDTVPLKDGWGWNGVASCRIQTPTASNCIDTPPIGDTWGWDGSRSCRIESTESICIDTEPFGNGWGWDGQQSCRLETPTSQTDCIDTPPAGDGWGWNGQQSCRITVQSESQRLPSGGHVSDPEFQWPAVTGASSYRLIIEDHRGDRISQQLSTREAGCDDVSTCYFRPSVQIHDSILKWRVQAFDSSGAWIETSEDVSFNTLRSLTAQPYTDLDTIGAPPNPGNGFPTLEFDQYLVLNNDWNAGAMYRDDWQQTVAVDRLSNGNTEIVIEYDWLGQYQGNEFAVKSYPQIVYGNKLGAHVSGTKAELGLPETISSLDEFRIDYSFTETGNAERNLAFESFFHTDCEITGPNFDVDDREYEMMVWIANPSIRTPGTLKAETGVLIDNQLWDVWIKPAENDKYIAFTAVNEVTSGTLNWNRFVDWTVNWSRTNRAVHNVRALDTGWCMSAIEFGPETFWGSSKLVITEFNVTRQ